ncbi:hypothetical protein V8C86DRAFT_2696192 [Haematococcus lacustris]
MEVASEPRKCRAQLWLRLRLMLPGSAALPRLDTAAAGPGRRQTRWEAAVIARFKGEGGRAVSCQEGGLPLKMACIQQLPTCRCTVSPALCSVPGARSLSSHTCKVSLSWGKGAVRAVGPRAVSARSAAGQQATRSKVTRVQPRRTLMRAASQADPGSATSCCTDPTTSLPRLPGSWFTSFKTSCCCTRHDL